MKKWLLRFCLFIFVFVPFIVNGLENPSLYSEYYAIYDLTDDKMLASLNADVETEIASLTKIMTVMVAIENVEDLDETVTITNSILNTVSWEASVAGLEVGDVVTYRDLLYAAMLPSGADATNALAILISGSINDYVDLMNDKAETLGLDNTHYVNVTGLDETGHYSTVNDVVILLKYSLENELFKEIFTTKNYTLANGLEISASVNFYNKIMGLDTSLILGSKTGFTDDAGYCIGIYFESSGHEFIAVTLNAPRVLNNYYNVVDALKVIEYVDNNYSYHTIVESDESVFSIPVFYSKTNDYDVISKDDIKLFLPNDYDKNKINVKYVGLEKLSYKNKYNDKLGVIEIYYDDELLNTTAVYLLSEIELSVFKIVWKYKWFIIIGITILYFMVKLKKKKRKKVLRTFNR